MSDAPGDGGTNESTPVLSLSNVDSGYGEVQVLDDCSIRLDAGEIVCLVGPNGAGKSTVLKTAFGMLTPWEAPSNTTAETSVGWRRKTSSARGSGTCPRPTTCSAR